MNSLHQIQPQPQTRAQKQRQRQRGRRRRHCVKFCWHMSQGFMTTFAMAVMDALSTGCSQTLLNYAETYRFDNSPRAVQRQDRYIRL